MNPISISSDEIEIACDLLWFVKREAALSGAAEELWDRLQPLRHGDSGGTVSASLSNDEAHAVIAAGDFVRPRVALDEDEAALVARLQSLFA